MAEKDKTIDTEMLMWWLDHMIKDCDDKIKNYPDIGTVKDNSTLGRKLGFQNLKSEIEDFQSGKLSLFSCYKKTD